jgi:hypothetical protein
MSDDEDGDEAGDFLADLEDLAAHLARAKAIAHLAEFFRDHWDPESEGPPALDDASSRDLAFYLLVSDRWDDLEEYLQAIWDRMFNDVPTRADDQPRIEIGAIHGIKPPDAGTDTWELALAVEDADTVITHAFKGWEVTATGGTV